MLFNIAKRPLRKFVPLMAMATICVACGGGGGSSTPATPADTVPVIASQPQSQAVAVGAAVTFAVSASGSSNLTYQWRRNDVAVSGATAATYQLSAAQFSDTKSTWSVTVTDGAGTVTSTEATLSVSGIAVYAGSVTDTGSTDGSLTAARFSRPAGLALDTSGNLYVADYGNATIRKITAAGQVSTIAGTAGVGGKADGTGSAASFNAPYGLAFDTSNNLYVTDTGYALIREISTAGVVTTLPVVIPVSGSRSAQLYQPGAIALDPQGNLYVTNSFGTRKITPAGVVSLIEGVADYTPSIDNTAAFSPRGVALDASGNVYIGGPGYVSGLPAAIYKVTAAGASTALAGTSGVSGASTLAFDASGNLYALSTNGDTLSKITPAGVVSTVAGVSAQNAVVTGALPGGLSQPAGMVIDASGAIYVSSGNAILKIQFP